MIKLEPDWNYRGLNAYLQAYYKPDQSENPRGLRLFVFEGPIIVIFMKFLNIYPEFDTTNREWVDRLGNV